MTTPGYELAEVYVMRKLHKEKMKRKEEERAKTEENIGFAVETSTSIGCFSSMFKKIHPSRDTSKSEHYGIKEVIKSCDKNKG